MDYYFVHLIDFALFWPAAYDAYFIGKILCLKLVRMYKEYHSWLHNMKGLLKGSIRLACQANTTGLVFEQ